MKTDAIKCLCLFVLCIMIKPVIAQDAGKKIPLWPAQDAPSEAYLLHFASAVAGPRGAVLICPGGGYSGLSMDSEGRQVAQFFNQIGLDAFVLRYSLNPKVQNPDGIRFLPLQEAARAVRLLRARSAEWQLDRQRIGVAGFSAGGHLASTLGTHFDSGDPGNMDSVGRQGSRPDFMILVYPVITFAEDFTHRGSRDNLLGKQPDPALVDTFSNEKQVSAQTPPAFLVHAHDDGVSPLNSIVFYMALQRHRVPAELHIYATGGHGFGLGRTKGGPAVAHWTDQLKDWLQRCGILR